MNIQRSDYTNLVDTIGKLLAESRSFVARQINTVLLKTYWQIGRYIVEFEQDGVYRAEYGSELLQQLARDLSLKYGKGFSRSNLTYMRKFYIKFPKFQISETASHKLTWSHYFEILKADSDLEISFYGRQCENENWNVRQLKRQMKSMLFQRLALSKDKEGVLKLAEEGQQLQSPEDIIKDPYVLEFLNLPQKAKYLEGELEEQIITNIQHFLLELGKGFAFIKKQYYLNIANRHFSVDLVFYHRILKCFVLIDLKRGEITHQDVGQMNLYLNYFRKEENTVGDSEPIGIILGAYKDHILIEYATQNISNKLFVSKYQLYLPQKEDFEKELQRILDRKQSNDD
jgi:predicted nuclease of restriction endonuclease-like (RecB) superfamily